MTRETDLVEIADQLLEPHGLEVSSCKVLQNLWAGYGVICRIDACPMSGAGAGRSLILKYVSPPAGEDEGHLRKLITYQVEKYFYESLAPQLPREVPVAECLGSCKVGEDGVALILQDLNQKFSVVGEKRGVLNEKQVEAAVEWLGEFHGFWWERMKGMRREEMRRPPLEDNGKNKGVWLNGGYTYLATRRKEYDSLRSDRSSEWSEKLCSPLPEAGGKSLAEGVALVLAPLPKASGKDMMRRYETLIHGDVKSENLFTTSSGNKVAFFDFQYVGLGLGVCDLAKLFTCSVPQSMLTSQDPMPQEFDMDAGEQQLLELYREAIDPTRKKYPSLELERHWKTALVDWLRFQASWGFWGNTEWLEARVRYIVKEKEWRDWVVRTARGKS